MIIFANKIGIWTRKKEELAKPPKSIMQRNTRGLERCVFGGDGKSGTEHVTTKYERRNRKQQRRDYHLSVGRW